MKYSIVIATYNKCDSLLKKCVEAIIAYTTLEDIELVIIANGCYDETKEYLLYLEAYFKRTKIGGFQQVFFTEALGYSRANNIGIKLCHADKIVLLNNDAFLLPQGKDTWLQLLDAQFLQHPNCGLSGCLKTHCNLTPLPHREFIIFFCVMIHRKVFDKIGYLDEGYGKGGGEDTEFCFKAEDEGGFEVRGAVVQKWSEELMLHVGDYPIYHKGEGTVHDVTLVPDWNEVFDRNSLKVASKYGRDWYRNRLGNNYERAVYLKEDTVAYRELTRYQWAAKNIVGKKVLEIGCSIGYGLQFLPEGIDYTGLDISEMIITAAKLEQWRPDAKFVCADVNTFPLEQYDTIIAFEVIEHMSNGFAVVELLKKHCQRLLLTVPKDEPPGLWGPHHKIHGLNEFHFPGFEFNYIDFDGVLHTEEPEVIGDRLNLLVGKWDDVEKKRRAEMKWFSVKHPGIYNEVVTSDTYHTVGERILNRNALDIGANVGAFTLLAGYLGAKKVVCAEPIAATYQILLENIEFSGLKNIVPFQNLVSDVSGKFIDVSLNDNMEANSMYNVGDKFETVETTTLGDLLKNFEDDDIFLKLDCEGAEYDILLNATQEEMSRVSQIVMEIHTTMHPVYKGHAVINEKLREFGFTCTLENQLYWWNHNEQGVLVITSEIPLRVVYWKR